MNLYFRIVSFGSTSLRDPRTPYFWVSEITQRHTTLGSTPLDEGSARRTDLYLTTRYIHKRQTSMPSAGFEIVIPSSEWPHTHFLAARPLGSAAFPYYNTFVSVIRFWYFYCVFFLSRLLTPGLWKSGMSVHNKLKTKTQRIRVYTRVGTLIVAIIDLQMIQNRYMFRSFTVLQCSHQHCVQPVASDVEVVGYL